MGIEKSSIENPQGFAGSCFEGSHGPAGLGQKGVVVRGNLDPTWRS